jgi:iron complex transport system substrate-binding protein
LNVSRKNIGGKTRYFSMPCIFVLMDANTGHFDFWILDFLVVKRLILFQVLFAIALSTGCSTPPPADNARTRAVQDGDGRVVHVPESIERVVSLAPSLTEMVFAAGAADRLVGVTTYCNYPAETASIAKVGDTQTPNIERIIALKPDVVLVSTDSQLEAFMNVLGEQKVAVYVTDAKKFEDVPQALRRLGELFGTEGTANGAADNMAAREQAVIERLATKKRPNVFVQISKDDLFTIGKTSFLTEVIERAGGVSMTRDIDSPYPKLSKETALALNPDVIILSDSEDNREPNDVFKNSPAVKNARVYRINADIISRPGPRLVDAMEQIANDLHP